MKGRTKSFISSLFCFGLGIVPVMADAGANHTGSTLQVTQQAKRSLSGTVTDATTGEPLIGVSILVKGTQGGTITDTNGNFSLPVSNGDILEVSYIGYKKESIVIKGQQTLNITMQTDSEILEEVVVVGYGSQKKVNLTGSVATVDFSDKTLSRPVTTVSSALSGMAAGLNVMQTTSKPNSENSSVLIRGNGTLNDSSPLILVDGMEMPLNEINPNDIATISVLKDAASCAIYGNRGANGVILVTTKRGSDGKINVTYSGKFSYNTPANLIHMVANYANYMELMNEASINSGQTQIFNGSTIKKWREADKNPNGLSESGYPNYVAYPNTDWYDEVYNPKLMQEHSITVSGAEKRTTYSLSATFLNNPGLVENAGMKKYYMRSDIESRITDFLTVGMRAWGYHTDQERNDVDNLNGLQMQKSIPGIYPRYDGKYGVPEATEEDPSASNPVYFINNAEGYYKQTKFFVNPYVKVNFLKHFTASYNFYYDHFRNEHKWNSSDYREQFSFQAGEVKNAPPTSDALQEYHVALWYDGDQSWKSSTVLNYSQMFGKKHDVSAMIGYEEYRKWRSTTDIDKKGMVDTNLTDFDALTDPRYIKGSTTEFASRSVFGRATYAYDSRYLLEANMRYDGSSRFAPESRWGLFPSFSAGWRLSEERFVKKLGWFDNLKLRASWGQLGNNSIGNYEWQAVYAATQYVFGNKKVSGLGMSSFSNYDLEWETTSITDFGLDFSVLNSRLTGTIDYYNKVTDGILYNPTLSPTLSYFGSPRQNIAEVTNRGFEVTLGWQDHIKDFTYGVSANFSFNKNEVSKYKGKLVREWKQDANGKWTYHTNLGEVSTGGNERIVEGHMINEYYVLNLYKGTGNSFNTDGTVNPAGGPADGMIRTEENMKWLKAMMTAGYQFYPKQGVGKDKIWYGDIIYDDLDGDGVYGDDDDRAFQGYSRTPKYYFGLQMNAAWKGFDLSMNWSGAAGFKINWYEKAQNSSIVTYGYGIGREVAYDHYFYDPENPDDPRTNLTSKTPRLTTDQAGQVSTASAWHLHNGNYLKLKNLTIGYTFPKTWVKKAYMQNVRIYASGENLFTITKFKGMDPEMMRGVGYAPMRQYAFGINVTF